MWLHTHEAGPVVHFKLLSFLWLCLNWRCGLHRTHWGQEVSNPWCPFPHQDSLSSCLSINSPRGYHEPFSFCHCYSRAHRRSSKLASNLNTSQILNIPIYPRELPWLESGFRGKTQDPLLWGCTPFLSPFPIPQSGTPWPLPSGPKVPTAETRKGSLSLSLLLLASAEVKNIWLRSCPQKLWRSYKVRVGGGGESEILGRRKLVDILNSLSSHPYDISRAVKNMCTWAPRWGVKLTTSLATLFHFGEYILLS